MIASAQTLARYQPVTPFVQRQKAFGMTFGLGPAGYDIRIAEDIQLLPGDFKLASSIEYFMMPNNLLGIVHDKSTWARLGLCVQNTVIEPGWKGFLTLELTNHNKDCALTIKAGMPISQIIFHMLDKDTDIPYKGKYQNQGEGPQPAILEPSNAD
jgi:dCTP deaminase